jgi:ribosomal-protein-alanine N-acetyltransferase
VETVIGSERLALRELAAEDWAAVHDWAARPEACRYQSWGPNTPEETRAHVERVLAAARQRPRADYTYLVVPVGEERPVGSGSLMLRGPRVGEIAYIVHPDRWGQGIATEVARLLLRLGFERFGLHRIYGTCDPRNVGSGRVLRKVGMTHEGRLREALLIRDGWRDSDLYAILEHEWSSASSRRASR